MAGLVAMVAACGAPQTARTDAPPVLGDSTAKVSMEAAQDIAGLHARWIQALANRDTAFFSATLVDNFQLTGGRGSLNKPQFLAAIQADTGGVAPSQFEETSVRLYGTVAVVSGLIRYDIPGEPRPALTRYTEVWVRDGQRWRVAHLHYNPVPPATPGTARPG